VWKEAALFQGDADIVVQENKGNDGRNTTGRMFELQGFEALGFLSSRVRGSRT
jgi:hypothetical protein